MQWMTIGMRGRVGFNQTLSELKVIITNFTLLPLHFGMRLPCHSNTAGRVESVFAYLLTYDIGIMKSPRLHPFCYSFKSGTHSPSPHATMYYNNSYNTRHCCYRFGQ